jgi:hypothetical protein
VGAFFGGALSVEVQSVPVAQVLSAPRRQDAPASGDGNPATENEVAESALMAQI